MRGTRLFQVALAGAAVALVAAGCGSSGGGGSSSGGKPQPPAMTPLATLGAGEGSINILAWPGYAEDGSSDKSVDWVTPFEQQTGCEANIKIADTSDQMFTLMGSGQYDVVSASGDSSLRMIYAGKVAPVNTDLFTNWADIAPFQKNQQWNSVNDVAYGIPHGWGANLLGFRTDKVTTTPDSWGVLYDADTPYAGKTGVYNSAADGIASAAVYLMATQPDLGITNPYALDQAQFDAAVNLAKQQKSVLGTYWAAYADAQKFLENGTTSVATTWQIIINLAQGNNAPVDAILPKEGATGWADTWMLDAKAKNPNCGYMWMNWITNPDIQAQVAEWFGEAPANLKACDDTSDPQHCETFHAGDEAYFDKVWFWATPQRACLDGRTDVECVPYDEWTKAWSGVTGS